MSRKGLLLIDLQNDFFTGGALAVPGAEAILPTVQALLNRPFDTVIATKDWHPANHVSFASNHPGRSPGDTLLVNGVVQHLWPRHCVAGSRGAEFAPGWDSTKVQHVIYKGTDPKIDSYSAFYDNQQLHQTELADLLAQLKIQELYVAGLATDYCVQYSVLDALSLGIATTVVVPGCRGVDLTPGDVQRSLETMRSSGAQLVLSPDAS